MDRKQSVASARENTLRQIVLDKANCKDDLIQNPLIDSSAEIASFKAAADSGEFVDAQQRLRRLEAANIDLEGVSDALIERVKRIPSQYLYSLPLLNMQEKDLSISVKMITSVSSGVLNCRTLRCTFITLSQCRI